MMTTTRVLTNPSLVLFAHVLFTLLVIGLVSQLSMLPYNLRELLTDNNTALLGIVLSLYVMTLPSLLPWRDELWYALYSPFFILIQTSLIFWLLYFTVPLESLHDILGSPVSQWPASLELWLRFNGFFGLIQFNSLFAIRILLAKKKLPLVILWIFYSIAWILLWDFAVVQLAGTDNITELLEDGGGYLVALAVNLYLALLFFTATFVCRTLKQPGLRQLLWLCLFIPLAFWLSWLLINSITENVILKYDQAFSALQFLLSTHRANYAAPEELLGRYMIGYGALLLIVTWFYALAQWLSDSRQST